MDALRSQLQLCWFNNGEHRSLAIVGIDPPDDAASLTARLAMACAASGSRTLVIDANLRNARMHQTFGIDNTPGLSDVLAGGVGLHAAIPPGSIEGLSALPAGPVKDHPERLLSRPRLASLIEEAQRQFDVILVETPPTSAYRDASAIASAAAGVLVTVLRHRTHARSLRQLATDLRAAGIPIVGATFIEP
jgi:receptor protein-tyrosine kinase